jgi:hypothetical protein
MAVEQYQVATAWREGSRRRVTDFAGYRVEERWPVSSDGSEGPRRAGENAFADRRRYHRCVSDPRARITFLLAGGGWPRQSSPSHAVY